MKNIIILFAVIVINYSMNAQHKTKMDSILSFKIEEFKILKKIRIKSHSGLEYVLTRVGNGGKPKINNIKHI